MYRKHLLKFTVLCSLVSFSCLAQEEKTYEVSNFKGVSFLGNFKISAQQGNSEGLTLKGRPQDLQKVKVEVSSGKLIVKLKNWKMKGIKVIEVRSSRKNTITVELQFKNLSSIDLLGACDWEGTNDMKFDDMNIDMSGASEYKQRLMGKHLKVDASGASEMDLSGKVNTLHLDLSGASEVDAESLECKKVDIDSSGASELSVHVTEELEVDASGASEVKYKGSPTKVNSSTSGASSLRKIKIK